MSDKKYLGPYARFVDIYSKEKPTEVESKKSHNILIDAAKSSSALNRKRIPSSSSYQSDINLVTFNEKKNSEFEIPHVKFEESKKDEDGIKLTPPKNNPFLHSIQAKVGNVLDDHIPKPDKKVLEASQKRYLIPHFFLRFFFDFFICFPFFIVKCFIDGFQEVRKHFHKRNTLFAFKLIGCYFLDILSPISVLCLHGLIIFGDKDHVYYQWCVTCYTLFISYLALTAYFTITLESDSSQVQQINHCKDLFSVKHWSNLGLGQFRDWLVAQRQVVKEKTSMDRLETDGSNRDILKYKTKDRLTLRNSFYSNLHKQIYSLDYFEKIMKKIYLKLNIDTTFLDFAYFGDTPKNILSEVDMDENNDNSILKHSDSMVEENDLHPTLERAMYYTKRKAKFLLWKIYKNSLDFTSKSDSDFYIELLVMLIIIAIKLVLPFVYALGFSTSDVRGFELVTIMVFYVYILSLFSSIIDNADLKRRSYILESLASMISFQGIKDSHSSIKVSELNFLKYRINNHPSR
jgi:hypothetical protein